MSNDVPLLVVAPVTGLPAAPSERVQPAARMQARRSAEATRRGGGFEQALDRAGATHLPIGKDSAVNATATSPTISGLFKIIKPEDQTSGLTSPPSSPPPNLARSGPSMAGVKPAPTTTHRVEASKSTKPSQTNHSDTIKTSPSQVQPDPTGSVVTPAIVPVALSPASQSPAGLRAPTDPVAVGTAKAAGPTSPDTSRSLPVAAAPPSPPDTSTQGLVSEPPTPAGRPAQPQTGETASARPKQTTDSATPRLAIGGLLPSVPSPVLPPDTPPAAAKPYRDASATGPSTAAAGPQALGAVGTARGPATSDTRPSSRILPVRRESASSDAAASPAKRVTAAGAPAAAVVAPVLPNAPPAAPDAAAPVAAAATPATSIAAQVAPALVSLVTRKDGSNEMTVSLHPRDLGQIDIRIARGSDGSTVVTVSASQPQTLQELASNVHHLHAALDAANIPVDSRTLNFVAPVASDPGQQFQSGSSGSNASTTQDQGSNTAGYQQQGSRPQSQGSPGTGTARYDAAAPVTMRRSWQISGLNITA